MHENKFLGDDGMDLFNVKSVDEVKQILQQEFKPQWGWEEIHVSEALGRIIFEDLVSDVHVPDFRRSTVDGFAVRAKDVTGASEGIPAVMDLKGEVNMGERCSLKLAHIGECVYVPTGGMIPEGADSMVMIEYTERLCDDTILVYKPSAQGECVVQVGEDIKKGEKVLTRGRRIRPYEIGLLSSIGINKIRVFKKPVVGIISTGDEVVSGDDDLKIGQIRDINSSILKSSAIEDGFRCIHYGIAKDQFEDLKEKADTALEECDVIMISGGSSVGKKDQTLKVIQSYESGSVLAHGIAVKPGKPTIVARIGEKSIFGLPGHPLSCSIIYEVIVRSFLNNIMDVENEKFGISCICGTSYHKAMGREEYLPVVIKEDSRGTVAYPIHTKSGMITGFTKAWGYVKIDKNNEGLASGQKIKAYEL